MHRNPNRNRNQRVVVVADESGTIPCTVIGPGRRLQLGLQPTVPTAKPTTDNEKLELGNKHSNAVTVTVEDTYNE